MTYGSRRISCGFLVLAVIAAGCANASAATADTEIAPEGSWERIGPCVEPDVFNRSNEPQTFTVQAFVHDRVSELAMTEELPPGGRAHLHLFPEAWAQQLGPRQYIALEDAFGCTFDVRRVLD